jgi:hypothetical protein
VISSISSSIEARKEVISMARLLITLLIVYTILTAIVGNVTAGTITSIGNVVGGGYIFVDWLTTTSPNNDNVTATEFNFNQLKENTFFLNFSSIDIVFNVANSGGTTEYEFFTGPHNFTVIEWNGYKVELGFGTGSNFTRSIQGDGLDFDTPDMDPPIVTTFFQHLTHSQDVVEFSDGIVPVGYSPLVFFSVDVPDNLSEFTFRATPSPVPEPTTILLVGSGLVGLVGFGRKRLYKKA